MTDEPDLISQEVVIDAVRNHGELSDDILRLAVAKFEALSPEAQQIYLEELRMKSQ